MPISFKDFSKAYDQFQETGRVDGVDPVLEAFFGFGSDEERVEKLLQMAKNGDREAATKLNNLIKDLQKRNKVTDKIALAAKSLKRIEDAFRSQDIHAIEKRIASRNVWDHVGKHHS